MPKKKGKKIDPKQRDQHMEAYSKATVSGHLDEVFNQWDKRYNLHTTIPYLDRADHIIINGRTVTELMVDKFNKDIPNMTLRDGTKVVTKVQRPLISEIMEPEKAFEPTPEQKRCKYCVYSDICGRAR